MSEKEILGLEDKRFGAMIKGDFKALDAMVHEQLFYTHSSGNTDTKPSWLEPPEHRECDAARADEHQQRVYDLRWSGSRGSPASTPWRTCRTGCPRGSASSRRALRR